jgi:hypothetical protein
MIVDLLVRSPYKHTPDSRAVECGLETNRDVRQSRWIQALCSHRGISFELGSDCRRDAREHR